MRRRKKKRNNQNRYSSKCHSCKMQKRYKLLTISQMSTNTMKMTCLEIWVNYRMKINIIDPNTIVIVYHLRLGIHY